MGVARPGSMRNFQHQVDQIRFYSGKEKMHCSNQFTAAMEDTGVDLCVDTDVLLKKAESASARM